MKKFHVKDANLFPINVDFSRDTPEGTKKAVNRVLFGRGNLYPQKKVMTFNKNADDFDFIVGYAPDSVPQDSEPTIYKVSLKEVATTFAKYADNSSVEAKGIKVHFKLDESGILLVDNIEAVFEHEYEEVVDQVDQLKEGISDAISKLGSTISKMFQSEDATGEVNVWTNCNSFRLLRILVIIVHGCLQSTLSMTWVLKKKFISAYKSWHFAI